MKLIHFLLVVIILAGISGCCAKRKCAGSALVLLEFNNFTPAEVDTVIVKTYLPNTSFNSLVDSTLVTGAFPVAALNSGIEYDYKIEIPATGQAFSVNDFEIKQVRCGSSLCGDNVDQVSGYSLNGQHHTGETIELFR